MADTDLIERLRMEAQIHAQEARTANATIAEIYQLCSGGKGEPGKWHGAEPVRALIADRADLLASLCGAASYIATLGGSSQPYRQLIAKVTGAADHDGDFKNFHRLLCERFGYAHDEADWKRDQVSLIEWIACQQAGRVDEGMVERVQAALNAPLPVEYLHTKSEVCAALTAALAQNTQVDGEAVAYFSADPAEGEFNLHKTLAEANAGAESLLESAQDEASDYGWQDEPPQICYGVVLGKCVELEGSRRPAPEGSEFTALVDYRLTQPVHAERVRVSWTDAEAVLANARNHLPTRVETQRLGDYSPEECAAYDAGYNDALNRAHNLLNRRTGYIAEVATDQRAEVK
ncbi:hypothetical protein [Frateuria sp.]|uniref:hypothetical protein n=1 Tax=Frateuria sp. TaxID=2211372 RepID=UPI003F7EA33F